MDENDFAGNVSSFREIGWTAAADIDHRNVLDRSERRRPRDGNAAYAELSLELCATFESGAVPVALTVISVAPSDQENGMVNSSV